MNIELCSNIVQTIVAVGASIVALGFVQRTRKIEWMLVAGFLCAFALGIAYWLTYQLLRMETPQIFYVADLAWLGAYFFIICLEVHITKPEVKGYRHWAVYVPFVIAVPLTVYFCLWGDVVLTVVFMVSLSYGGYLGLQNLLYNRAHGIKSLDTGLHLFSVVYMATEFALWLASCFWISDTLRNPYFWFDFAITAELVWLVVATKKAVDG